MAYALAANAAAGSTDGNAATTSGIDTTGANLLVVAVTYYVLGGTVSVSDSKGNTWTQAAEDGGNNATGHATLFYSKNPSVGSGHTFTVTSTGGFPGICAAAFSGADTAAPFDQQSAFGSGGASSIQPGSVTPSEDNELLVTAVSKAAAGVTASVDGGFSETDEFDLVGGQHFGLAMAYLVQTSAAAANPTWTLSGSASTAAAIATFKAGAGGGGGGVFNPYYYRHLAGHTGGRF